MRKAPSLQQRPPRSRSQSYRVHGKKAAGRQDRQRHAGPASKSGARLANLCLGGFKAVLIHDDWMMAPGSVVVWFFFCLALAQNRSTSVPLFSHLPFTNNKLFKVQHVKLLEKRSNTYRGIYILTSILLSFQVIAILPQDQV